MDDPGFDPDDPDHDARYYYALLNANYNVVMLLDAEGLVAERYPYEPYWTEMNLYHIPPLVS